MRNETKDIDIHRKNITKMKKKQSQLQYLCQCCKAMIMSLFFVEIQLIFKINCSKTFWHIVITTMTMFNECNINSLYRFGYDKTHPKLSFLAGQAMRLKAAQKQAPQFQFPFKLQQLGNFQWPRLPSELGLRSGLIAFSYKSNIYSTVIQLIQLWKSYCVSNPIDSIL